MSDERTNLGTNLLLFLAGAAIGAAVVALVTPKSGPDLRADIKDLAGKLRRKAREAGAALCPECGREGQAEAEEEEELGI
jgi:gas vesicle protein